MFTKTSNYYDALYHFKDYEAACAQLNLLIKKYTPHAKNLLDVACGTGKHLQYLQEYFEVEGLDLDPALLEVARKRCAGVTFYNEDMTDFKLPATYDVVVCLFSSIAYVKTVENLDKTMYSMAKHLNPGGFILIEPWIYPDDYWVGRVTANFVDQPELKIAWMYTSELEEKTSIFDINYMVGTPQGIDNFTEKHVMGLWTDDEYRKAFEKVGINVFYDSIGLFGRGMYFGVKS